MKPTISVITPVWNGARWLGEALASARAQTLPPDEIIVLDDGSSDDSAAIARAVEGVRCVTHPHAGVAAARNRGLDEARGELIAFLDADDRWPPEKLAVHVEYLRAHPELGYALTHQRFVIEEGTEVPAWVGDGSDALCWATSSLAAWRWAFDKVGRFDPARVTGEDGDWLARAVDAGVPGGEIRQPLVLRRVHPGNLSSLHRGQVREDVFAVLRASIARKRGKG